MSDLARVDTRRAGTTQLVRITGELDLSNARELTDAVGHAVPDDVTLVVVDLSGTTYLDSGGIAAFFRLSQRLRDRRQDLRLVVPDASPIRAVVELTRLSQVIPVDQSAPDLSGQMAYAALPPDSAPDRSQPPATTDAPDPGAPDMSDPEGDQRNG
ncbi:STAS domain-containing protein [Terracoccus sp. 273MFTsu3.1]|uniref:STAS domain-containing protein n=1 Tax=Terracoccus sp. 273MFTsu3.1 TaxID=1172188 RepID=UPI00037FF4CC|nr:STAS domain-containing protein [Terracoccus sp. 273MFTsu3.1]